MNTVIEKGKGFFVCQVDKFFEDRGFGFAVYQKDRVYFHAKCGRAIVPGRKHPEFREDVFARKPKKGDWVVLFVEETPQGWSATIWGSAKELYEAECAIELRTQPKCPPVPPPIPKQGSSGDIIPFAQIIASVEKGKVTESLGAAMDFGRAAQTKAPQSQRDRRRSQLGDKSATA